MNKAVFCRACWYAARHRPNVARMRTLALLVLLLVLSTVESSQAAPAPRAFELPLKVGPTGRYLVDQQEKPFLVTGDTAWSIIVQLDEPSVERYLEDRQRRGFNSIIVNLIEHKFGTRPPATRAGLEPFLDATDFSRPNPAYFEQAHRAVERANHYGIVVWLVPAYLGYGGGDEGFFKEIKAGGRERLEAYGRFVGRKFSDLPNIVWMLGGDYTPEPGDRWSVTTLGTAIRQEDQRHLMTVHTAPEGTAIAIFGQEPWATLNTVYSYKPALFEPLQAAYAVAPPRPFVMIESTYEGEHDSKPPQIRRQAYWSILCGAAGQFLGNNPIWHFDGPGLFPSPLTWDQALDSQGSRDMATLHRLFEQVPWWELKPQPGPGLVIEGAGEGIGQTLTAVATSRKLSVTYIPSIGTEPRVLTLDTRHLANPVTARWFNPVSGELTTAKESPLASSSRVSVRTPGDNGSGASDWILVLAGTSPGGGASD